MLIFLNSAARTLSLTASCIRDIVRRRSRGVGDRQPIVEVTLFRFVVVMPGARLERGGKL